MERKRTKFYKLHDWYSRIVLIAAIFVMCINFSERIDAPSFIAIVQEILIHLDPVALIKGGKPLDPHDWVNWWE